MDLDLGGKSGIGSMMYWNSWPKKAGKSRTISFCVHCTTIESETFGNGTIIEKLNNLYFTLDTHISCGIISIMKDIEKQLEQAIIESGLSCYRIAKESGLTESQLSYFINGKRSLTLPAAAKLAKVLGLELIKRTKK